MRSAIVAVLLLALGLLLLFKPPGVDAQPEVTLVFPEDGSVLAEPPPIIHLCFADPVNIRDRSDGGDFLFRVLKPDGSGVGLRIVFQGNGSGVNIHSNIPEDPPEGEWTFEWRVTDPDTLEPASGTISFTVGPDGDPVPIEEPDRCPGPPVPLQDVTPSPTDAADEAEEAEDDDDQDILLLALIATGTVIGAAALGLILYLVRRRSKSSSGQAAPPKGLDGGEGHQ